MNKILLVFILVVLGTCTLVNPPPAIAPKPPKTCTVQTSTWQITNFPMIGNTQVFRFQRRTDCKHYFRMRSTCSSFEVEYRTTHSTTAAVSYTTLAVSENLFYLSTCTSPTTILLEENLVNAFIPAPKSGNYYLFLTTAPNKIHWGGYVATWLSGPKKIWFS